jgi:lipid-binding SYLF domain-containing protein
MKKTEFRTRGIAAACMLALSSISGVATAQTSPDRIIMAEPPVATGAAIADKTDAIAQINQAVRVVDEMKREPEARQLLENARGVFIVTSYARAGFGLGVRGGEGVLMVKQNGNWSNPAFYNFGGISGGLQAGAEAGSLVMVLNNEKAVQSFMQNNNWSLNADAGLTIVAWSERAKGEVGTGDITLWSNASGLMADLAVSVTDISFDEEETGAFYGRQIALQDILTTDMGPLPHVANLKQALPGGAQSTGGTGDVAPDAIITIVPVVPEEQGGTSQGGTSQGGASQSGNTGIPESNPGQPQGVPGNGATGATGSGTWQASASPNADASGQRAGTVDSAPGSR